MTTKTLMKRLASQTDWGQETISQMKEKSIFEQLGDSMHIVSKFLSPMDVKQMIDSQTTTIQKNQLSQCFDDYKHEWVKNKSIFWATKKIDRNKILEILCFEKVEILGEQKIVNDWIESISCILEKFDTWLYDKKEGKEVENEYFSMLEKELSKQHRIVVHGQFKMDTNIVYNDLPWVYEFVGPCFFCFISKHLFTGVLRDYEYLPSFLPSPYPYYYFDLNDIPPTSLPFTNIILILKSMVSLKNLHYWLNHPNIHFQKLEINPTEKGLGEQNLSLLINQLSNHLPNELEFHFDQMDQNWNSEYEKIIPFFVSSLVRVTITINTKNWQSLTEKIICWTPIVLKCGFWISQVVETIEKWEKYFEQIKQFAQTHEKVKKIEIKMSYSNEFLEDEKTEALLRLQKSFSPWDIYRSFDNYLVYIIVPKR